jgi:hypothetical protein
MPQFILTSDCKRLMADAGVTRADLLGGDGQVCLSISKDVSRMTMARWRLGDRIILIDGPIKKAAIVDGRPVVELMEPLLVLALKPDLPAGRITRDHDIEELLALVAESFGVPVRCHPEEPWSTLYSGRFDGKLEVQKDRLAVDHDFLLYGHFDHDAKWANLAYTIDITKYLEWVRGKSALRSWTSRASMPKLILKSAFSFFCRMKVRTERQAPRPS